MKFSQAIESLRAGKCIAHEDFEDYEFIVKQKTNNVSSEVIPKMNSLPDDAKKILEFRGNSLCYRNQLIKVYPCGNITSFIPTAEQLFSGGWFEVDALE